MLGFQHYYDVNVKDHVMNNGDSTPDNKFQKIMDEYGLFVLLLTANGTVKTTINTDEKDKIEHLVCKINGLSAETKENLNVIADEVSLLAASLIKLFGEEGKTFQKYFRQFAMIELLEQHLSEKIAFIKKEDNLIDYKINRVAKYLKIDIDKKAIKDFTVMYNGDIIKLNGQDYYIQEKKEKNEMPKINKIVRQ